MSNGISKSDTVKLCQIETADKGGRLRRPGFLYIPMRILQNLQRRGFGYTLRATLLPPLASVKRRFAASEPAAAGSHRVDAVLNLQPGELVEVKALEEILQTLDDKGRHRGLTFTPEMRQHCGKAYRVFKRLELMFDEYHKSQRRIKDTVLLENVVCRGAGLGCDRSCFLYWREVWLRRIDTDL